MTYSLRHPWKTKFRGNLTIQLDLAGSPLEAAQKVLAAVGAGQLTPDQAAKLMTTIGHLSHAIEVDEVLRRLDALEQQAHERRHA